MYDPSLSALLHMMGRVLPCKQRKWEEHEMYFEELWMALFQVMGASERNCPVDTSTTCIMECLGS
jgi:hypothetical protein